MKTFGVKASIAVTLALLVILPSKAKSDELLFSIPPLVASFQCDANELSACKNPTGCRLVNGVWANSICTVKPDNQLRTEQLQGLWASTTIFSNGVFFNYLSFDPDTVKRISGSNDYLIKGSSHSSSTFSDINPSFVVGTYDSSNQDWFVLDYWGLDIGLISSFEIIESNNGRFSGCEYILNYPDLTYKDGVCNPIILKPTTATAVSLNSTAKIESTRLSSLGSPVSRKNSGAYRPHAKTLNLSVKINGESHE